MSLRTALTFRWGLLPLSVALALGACHSAWGNNAMDTIEFNTDVLDVEDKKNINLAHFSRPGYLMPGTYLLALKVNEDTLSEVAIPFYAPPDDPEGSLA